ncbi:MAG: 50S ribosomal protein L29 [Candidatus Levybacteria bacterium RIFCSPHIGHO2_01_FULL_38_26]|nr:MAG: 50S ribosomal protein L29 [Candidatus Levybacteria bacterium RIFCSPHIGHO2_01_FULL_38_26]
MKTKDKKALHGKTLQELNAQLLEARNELHSLKLDKSLIKLKNTRSIFEKRKEIAQILTIIKIKEPPAGGQGK